MVVITLSCDYGHFIISKNGTKPNFVNLLVFQINKKKFYEDVLILELSNKSKQIIHDMLTWIKFTKIDALTNKSFGRLFLIFCLAI